MNKTHRIAFALLVLLGAPAVTSAQSFFDNFSKPEYLVPVSTFPASSGGDLNLTYYQVPIPLLTNGEMLIVGEFPRARYFSITVYDDHGAVLSTINDKDLRPLGSAANPYAPGGPAGAEDILYAVTVRLVDAMALNPLPQCATPSDVHQNILDARPRHTAGTFYSNDQRGFSANTRDFGSVTHNDSTSNTGTFVMLRTYMQQPPAASSKFDLRQPLVWVRAASTGCAPQLAPTGQSLSPSQWFSLSSILKLDQVSAHVQHEIDLGTSAPYGTDPVGEAPWFGRDEYMPGQAIGRYLALTLPAGNTPADLNAQGRVLQLGFRLPVLPCPGAAVCQISGNEDLRYWSLTFEDGPGHSLGSITELSLTPDAQGYVTLVISFGTTLPSYVKPANGYSRVVIPSTAVARLVLRNYLPSSTFVCHTSNVPPRTAEYQPGGGYMGEYAPVATFPSAGTLPTVTTALVQPNNCVFQ